VAFTQTTLSDLKILLNQRRDYSLFWTDEEARLALNEALREWNLWTGRWRRRVILTSSVGQPQYTLPSTMTYGMAVRVLGSALHPSSYYDLDVSRPQWRLETAGATGVPAAPVLWAPQSLTQFVIWPAPATSSPNDLAVDGVSATPILVYEEDTVDLGEELIGIILDYAIHVLAFKEGGSRWKATLGAWQTLLKAAAEDNGRLKANQAFRKAAGLDYRRQQQPARGRPTDMDTMQPPQI
jgi:hypothetical protein